MSSLSLLDTIDRKLPIHLVGIGGVSMSALAQMLLHLGAPVSGSDRDDTEITRRLKEQGAVVYQGHTAPSSWAMPSWSSAPPPSRMTIPRSRRPGRGASPSGSAPRPGAC